MARDYFQEPSATITATFRAWAAREPRVKEFHGESDGIFIVTAPGYCDDHGAHTVRGNNSADAMRRFKRDVRACACDGCQKSKAEGRDVR